MKYVLVNKLDEIVSKVDLSEADGRVGAHTYFKGVKRMPDDEDFDKLWKVMTEDEYNSTFHNNLQNRQMGNMKYEWWKDEETYLDADAPVTESNDMHLDLKAQINSPYNDGWTKKHFKKELEERENETIFESPDGGKTIKKRKLGDYNG